MTDTEMHEKIKTLTKTRGFVRTKITTLVKKVDREIDSWNDIELNMHLLKAKQFITEIQEMDQLLTNLYINVGATEQQLADEMDGSERYMDTLLMIVSKLETKPPEVQSNTPGFSNQMIDVGTNSHMKLPTIDLPKYSHESGENLGKFIKIFDGIMDKAPHLSDHQKFLLLQKQLGGPPRILLDTLDYDDHKYGVAKEALLAAFDSTDKSKEEILKTLSSMTMGDGQEPYKYIGLVRTVMSGMKSLKVGIDDVLRYFIWNGFNSDFRGHLTDITNKFKPNITEITNNMFEAADRYLSASSNTKTSAVVNKVKKNNENSVNAININSQKKSFCNLCKADNKQYEHPMSKCTVYVTSKQKIDKIRKLKGCIKCSFSNHETSACRFIFKSKCRHCNGDHYSFLCLTPRSDNRTEANAIEIENTSDNDLQVHSTCTATFQTYSSGQLILPTFTAHCKINDENYIPLRVFKDGGSQASFLSTDIADMYKLPVVANNVPLNIRGFNSTKRINTKVVKLEIKFENNIFSKDIICVKNIRTKFNVEGMSDIISAFREKGHSIADTEYNNNTNGIVDNIDLILGADADFMLPMKYQTFGASPNNSASFIETPIGVVFSGCIKKMHENIRFIPNKVQEIQSNFIEATYPYIYSPIDRTPSVLKEELVCDSMSSTPEAVTSYPSYQ